MGDSLEQFWRKSKAELPIVIIVLLVGFAGFGLGRLSATNSTISQVGVEANAGKFGDYRESKPDFSSKSQNTAEPALKQQNNAIFASKNGKSYYFSNCKAGSRVKPENRVYFGSEEEAQSAGYEKSSSCK